MMRLLNVVFPRGGGISVPNGRNFRKYPKIALNFVPFLTSTEPKCEPKKVRQCRILCLTQVVSLIGLEKVFPVYQKLLVTRHDTILRDSWRVSRSAAKNWKWKSQPLLEKVKQTVPSHICRKWHVKYLEHWWHDTSTLPILPKMLVIIWWTTTLGNANTGR